MGAFSRKTVAEGAKSDQRHQDQEQPADKSQRTGSVFDMPRDYMTGRLPRLANQAREWWLNVNYVESEGESEDEVVSLLIHRNRRARKAEKEKAS